MIGFAMPAILMFPILAIQLVLFYSGLDKKLKSHRYPLLEFVYVFFAFLIVYASFYLIRKTQEKLVKNYVVELNAASIRILENGKEIMAGSVSDCRIINNIKGSRTNHVSIILYTDTDKIAFRLRDKTMKNIMGSDQPNFFGTSDLNDMETALNLGKDIQEILEKPVSISY